MAKDDKFRMTGVKVDNRSLATKIALRRWLLAKMGITEVRVLDTCAGAGHVWSTMQDHVTVRQWTRCDIKPRQAGTLQIEASDAIRSLPLDLFNVIDIDPYGEPWGAYAEMLKRLTQRTAVFLTCGRVSIKQSSHPSLEFIGVPTEWGNLMPRSAYVSDFVTKRCIERTWEFAQIGAAATFARAENNVRYWALDLTPHRAEGGTPSGL